MSEWSMEELTDWDNKICAIGEGLTLDWYPIEYEICNYKEMIGHMAYTGLPTHYRHWSFGKSFDRIQTEYNLGMSGLPYEMIINSNPSISYLMTENPMSTHILTMAHCVGHSDFFKNNRMFKETGADTVISRFKSAGKRVKKYMEDPIRRQRSLARSTAWTKENPERSREIKANWNRYNLYGLTPERYNQMLEDQQYRCLSCNREESLVVDHNHDTGEVRGLICNKCNITVGFIEGDRHNDALALFKQGEQQVFGLDLLLAVGLGCLL